MTENEYRYSCEKCAFFSNAKSTYEIHLSTGKHKRGHNTVRCDKKYPEKCPLCNYEPKSNVNYMQHYLTFHSTKDDRKEKFAYFCEKCDFGSFSKKTFSVHENTMRHKLLNV
jgi:hypothetical protein